MNGRELGQRGEEAARRYLERHGYRIMDRNFRVRRGEVDLIFRDGGTIVFAEVKTRRGSAFGDPAQAVTERKQEQIAAVALVYLQKRELPLSTSCRFDVLAVLADGDRARITHFRNAFPFRSRYD